VSPGPAAALTESAVLVQVPAAEPAVSRHRTRLDAAAGLGVPAHVTILSPFLPPPAITSTTLAILAEAVASVAAFDCQFPATAWFGTDVLWLAPRPHEPFRALIRAVSAAFPGYPPFGGLYSEVIPHLTVGNRPAGGSAELRAAEAEMAPALPIAARIGQVHLMAGSTAPGSWRVLAELPLATR
jgi:hypothetical protein